ncbi:MAG: hypothetical protein PHF14_06075, partial [Verrucomicrobiota bacterium]|nr:hypothetical protein [Verrucomicrobiota bacterium]
DFVSLDKIVISDFFESDCCSAKSPAFGTGKDLQGMAEPIQNLKIGRDLLEIIYSACCMEWEKDQEAEKLNKVIPYLMPGLNNFIGM